MNRIIHAGSYKSSAKDKVIIWISRKTNNAAAVARLREIPTAAIEKKDWQRRTKDK